MKIEVKKHSWQEDGEKFSPQYVVFVDGKPRTDIGCDKCVHLNKEGNCDLPEEKVELFCGLVCKYFKVF